MATLIALYNKPADVAAFDDYYFSRHVPLAKTIPGLRRYETSSGAIGSAYTDSPYHLIAILTFDSMDAIQAALGSPDGKATAGDLSNFAQAGVELLTFDTKEI